MPSYISSVLGDITFDELAMIAALVSVSAVVVYLFATIVWRRFSISVAEKLAPEMTDSQVILRINITADILILTACLLSAVVLGPVILAVLVMGIAFVYIGFFVRRLESNRRPLPFGIDAYHLKLVLLFFIYFTSTVLIILQMVFQSERPLIVAIVMLVVVRVTNNASSRVGDYLFKLTSQKK